MCAPFIRILLLVYICSLFTHNALDQLAKALPDDVLQKYEERFAEESLNKAAMPDLVRYIDLKYKAMKKFCCMCDMKVSTVSPVNFLMSSFLSCCPITIIGRCVIVKCNHV